MIVVFLIVNKNIQPLVYLATLIVHELAHGAVAKHYGYALCGISISMFGAELKLNDEFQSPTEEIAVALAGPILNIVICITLLASWWVFPALYVYTELFFNCNLSLVICNLLPLYPLDGGRILKAFLSGISTKKSKAIFATISAISVMFMLCLFVASCFSVPNYTILMLLIFIFINYFSVISPNYKMKINMFENTKKYGKILKTKIVTIPSKMPIYRFLRYFSNNYYVVFNVVFENGKNVLISEHKLIELSKHFAPDAKIDNIVRVKK